MGDRTAEVGAYKSILSFSGCIEGANGRWARDESKLISCAGRWMGNYLGRAADALGAINYDKGCRREAISYFDQIIPRTMRPRQSSSDRALQRHVAFADVYCPDGQRAVRAPARGILSPASARGSVYMRLLFGEPRERSTGLRYTAIKAWLTGDCARRACWWWLRVAWWVFKGESFCINRWIVARSLRLILLYRIDRQAWGRILYDCLNIVSWILTITNKSGMRMW